MNAEGREGGARQWKKCLSLDYIFICRHMRACCIVSLLVYFCGYVLFLLGGRVVRRTQDASQVRRPRGMRIKS